MAKLPLIPCDCCKSAACTQWFGRTSVVICDSPECRDEMLRRYDEACQKTEEEDAAYREFYGCSPRSW